MSIYRRFFVEQQDICNSLVDLTSQYQHIAKVLRMRVGDTIIACCGDMIEHTCLIRSITATEITANIISSKLSDNESVCNTTLYVGVLKGDKNDFVIQKAVELGVSNIIMFDSLYTVAEVSASKLVRLNRIAEEAVKQCDRAVKVEVRHIGSLERIDLTAHSLVLLCYERKEGYTIAQCLADNQYPKDVAIIIGSEGGFDVGEVDSLITHGAQVVTLGKRILRAETAPIYALSVIDSLYIEGPNIED